MSEQVLEDLPLLAQRRAALARAVQADLADVLGAIEQAGEQCQLKGRGEENAQRVEAESETDAGALTQAERETLVGGRQLRDRHDHDASSARVAEHLGGARVALQVTVAVDEAGVSQGGHGCGRSRRR